MQGIQKKSETVNLRNVQSLRLEPRDKFRCGWDSISEVLVLLRKDPQLLEKMSTLRQSQFLQSALLAHAEA
ncbi:MAG: hypothetical protein ABR981_00975 [Candidatus Micrarchaeaceae archaeon]